ncbi:hypothetical protein [Peribacillus simplex]|uniref:hypothetical protein n=1 Tax=Peribacillus simplex TaxID=1478 RepID=UPI0024C1B03B|nr:hypothetical protein [Peribacillus simplex]WHY55367.1 hypothetical protein QNH43_19700 [Peribacillus simplex]
MMEIIRRIYFPTLFICKPNLAVILKGSFRKECCFLKLNYLSLIGAQVRDSCGRLTARPAESEHLEGKSTTPLYLVNSNKVCENSLLKKPLGKGLARNSQWTICLFIVKAARYNDKGILF